MASAIYPKAKEKFLQGIINMSSATIKVALVDTGVYTYSAAHEFYSSITGVVGTPVSLTTKTFTNGSFDADDAVFSAVSGNTIEAIVIYSDTGIAGTSPVIAYLDGLNVTPNGGSISLIWASVSPFIFTL
jgi:hypothetical protein